jgi:hypothetical protein
MRTITYKYKEYQKLAFYSDKRILGITNSYHSSSTHLINCRLTAAIQERVTAVLRSIPKEAFADSFQKLYERCQQCAVKGGDYFEGQ